MRVFPYVKSAGIKDPSGFQALHYLYTVVHLSIHSVSSVRDAKEAFCSKVQIFIKEILIFATFYKHYFLGRRITADKSSRNGN